MDRPSAAERKRKSRAKQNEAKKLEERAKAKNGMKVLRLKREGDKNLKKTEAEASKLRMRKFRENRKSKSSSHQQPTFKPYSTPQTLGKAVRRIKIALPSSPRKQQAVVEKLVSDLGLLIPSTKPVKNFDLSKDTIVTEFLCRTDIVYTAPGMHDEMTIWEKGVKNRVRKLYLTMYMKEAHALFKEEHPTLNIGYSKFCSLRPQNVLLFKDTPCDQCKCQSHENFIMLIKGLNINYNNEFWKQVLCNSALESDCWETKCEKCSAGESLLRLISKDGLNDASTNVQWHQWVKSACKRFFKEAYEGCVGELTERIVENFQHFKQHVHIKRIQAAAFQYDIKQNDTVVLQVDFAMSYSCEWQSEIQSALWSRENVTLFTCALFENTSKTQCYLIASDTKDKSKVTVSSFIFKLLEVINFVSKKPKLIIWSDGPSSEFKNKFICYFLFRLSKIQNRFSSFEWKYSATSHGKGVVDGIGGAAKSRVYAEVKARRAIVQNVVDFTKVATKVVPNVTVISMLQKDIDNTQIDWNVAKDVPGIKKAHFVKCSDNHIYLFTSQQNLDTPIQELCYCENTEQCFKITQQPAEDAISSVDISLGMFVLVKVFGKRSWKPFVAQVSAVEGADIDVDFLKQVSPLNFLYQQNDTGIIQHDDIIKVLPTPIISKRNIVIFPNSVM